MLAEEDVVLAAVAEDSGGEEEAAEAEGAEVAGVEGVTAEAGEVFGGGVVLPEAAAGGGVPEGEEGGAGDGGEEEGRGSGEDPAEVLDAGAGAGARGGDLGVVGFEPEEELTGAEVQKGNAALAVADGEAEVGKGGVGGGEGAEEGLEWGPAEGGDEGGEGRGGGSGHGEDGDQLGGVDIDDRDAAARAEGEEARGAAVAAAAIAAARWSRKHEIPRLLRQFQVRRRRHLPSPLHLLLLFLLLLLLLLSSSSLLRERRGEFDKGREAFIVSRGESGFRAIFFGRPGLVGWVGSSPSRFWARTVWLGVGTGREGSRLERRLGFW